MALISTQQYDRTLAAIRQTYQRLQDSYPVRLIRKIHADSFAEVQRRQELLEEGNTAVPPKATPAPLLPHRRPLQLQAWSERDWPERDAQRQSRIDAR